MGPIMTEQVSELQVERETGAFTAEKTVRILQAHGLHGRPTTAFVKLAQDFASNIAVSRDGVSHEVDGKSALAVLALGLEPGSFLRITARGPDAEEAVEALSSLVRKRFRKE